MMRAPEPDCAERIILFFFHAANNLCAFYNTAHRVADDGVFRTSSPGRNVLLT